MNDVIILASDHNGITLNDALRQRLKHDDIKCINIGPYDQNIRVDYVDYARQACTILTLGDASRVILSCGTGVGMCIVANRYAGVRAALAHSVDVAIKSRQHNDANVLCLGAWINDVTVNVDIMNKWLTTSYDRGRHVRRLNKIDIKHSIVFTNGVFDIIHAGHIELLKFARSLGDRLVVAIDSDERVRAIKGVGRPVNSANDRCAVLRAIDAVDEVFVFNDVDELVALREMTCAGIVVKGSEYTVSDIRERDIVSDDVDVVIFPNVADYSTTNMLIRSNALGSWKKQAS